MASGDCRPFATMPLYLEHQVAAMLVRYFHVSARHVVFLLMAKTVVTSCGP